VHVPGLGEAPADGSVNLLVVGSDTRQGLRDGGFGEAAGQRSDVIIVVHLVPAARHAAVLSIPRDLYVPVAGTGGSAKINSAFNRGPGQLVQTIQQSFGIPIHHYCWSTSTASARWSTPSAGSPCTSPARSATATTATTNPG
jgi:anionic cell wall polymer biosynthesis LytR-Cps2A-Psr (LCP) family protein